MTLGLFGGAWWILDHATAGLYRQNAVEVLLRNITWSNPIDIGRAVIEGDPVIVGLTVVAIARRCARRQFDLLSLYVLLAAPFAALGTLCDGSATNYFLGVMAVSTIVGAEELALWTGLVRRRARSPAAASSTPRVAASGRGWVTTLAILPILLLILPRVYRALPEARMLPRQLELRQTRDAELMGALEAIVKTLDGLDGPILSQDNDINLRTRHAIMFELLTFGSLADHGRFDDSALIDMIRTQKLGAVVLQFPVSVPEIPRYQSTSWVRESWIKAIRASGYEETRVSGAWYVYKPIRSSLVIHRMLEERGR